MTCARCPRTLSNDPYAVARRKTPLCQRCASMKQGSMIRRMQARMAIRAAVRRTGLRKIATILKGLP